MVQKIAVVILEKVLDAMAFLNFGFHMRKANSANPL